VTARARVGATAWARLSGRASLEDGRGELDALADSDGSGEAEGVGDSAAVGESVAVGDPEVLGEDVPEPDGVAVAVFPAAGVGLDGDWSSAGVPAAVAVALGGVGVGVPASAVAQNTTNKVAIKPVVVVNLILVRDTQETLRDSSPHCLWFELRDELPAALRRDDVISEKAVPAALLVESVVSDEEHL